MTRLVAILPRKKLDPRRPRKLLAKALEDLANDLIKGMQFYPPPQPWNLYKRKDGSIKKGYPRNAKSFYGRRSGRYKKGWRKIPHSNSIDVVNNVFYAVYVGGRRRGKKPRQTAAMRKRGWPSTEDVGPPIRKLHREKFQKAISIVVK